jgi:hypothetical protein
MSASLDDDDLLIAQRDVLGERIVRLGAVLGSAVVVGLFFVTLAQAQPVPDVGVVVVADPAVPPGQPLFVRVLGLLPSTRAPFVGTVDGAVVDDRGLAVVPRARTLAVRGTVDAVPVELDIELDAQLDAQVDVQVDAHRTADVIADQGQGPSAPTGRTNARSRAGVAVSPWTKALAVPSAGAAVYPEAGIVRARGRGRVLLVDDRVAQVVDVEPALQGRLPDGRLLQVDRTPWSARLVSLAVEPGGEVAVDVAGLAHDEALSLQLLVDGVLVGMKDERGNGRHGFRLAGSEAPGTLIVLRVATSPLPSSPGKVVVTRVMGPRPEDLTRVEPRIAHVDRSNVDDELIARALTARLVPEKAQATIVSPSLSVQKAQREVARRDDVERWRSLLRLASGLVLALVVLAAGAAVRRAPFASLGALLVVAVVLFGLDLVVGAVVATAQS